VTAPAVAAYNGAAAAAYADSWVQNGQTLQNPNYPDYGVIDCTNFVSQALAAGGYPMQGFGQDKTKYTNWWLDHNVFGFSNSFSWSVAPDLLNMLYYDSPGGSPLAYRSPSQQGPGYRSGGATGDVIFYDWGVGEGVSHVTIQVGYGTDPVSHWTGDLVDEHSSDREHAFWSLQPYNADRSGTTYITVARVSANN
jgi:cell wall-associated NlpC family hydrolase